MPTYLFITKGDEQTEIYSKMKAIIILLVIDQRIKDSLITTLEDHISTSSHLTTQK